MGLIERLRTAVLVLFPLSWASLLAACSLIISLDGLSGGPDELSGGPDEMEGGTDAAVADTAFDSEGSPAEAATPGPSPCSSGTHALCIDFDDGPLQKGWDTVDVTAPIEVTLSSARSVSGQRSARATIPQRASTDALSGGMARTFSGDWHKFHLELDVFIERTATQGAESTPAFLVALLRTGGVQTGTVLAALAASTRVSVEGSPSTYLSGPMLPGDTWAHVVLDFDRIAGTYRYDLAGKIGSTTFVPLQTGANSSMVLNIGIHSFAGPSPTHTVYFDNVVLDLE